MLGSSEIYRTRVGNYIIEYVNHEYEDYIVALDFSGKIDQILKKGFEIEKSIIDSATQAFIHKNPLPHTTDTKMYLNTYLLQSYEFVDQELKLLVDNAIGEFR